MRCMRGKLIVVGVSSCWVVTGELIIRLRPVSECLTTTKVSQFGSLFTRGVETVAGVLGLSECLPELGRWLFMVKQRR